MNTSILAAGLLAALLSVQPTMAQSAESNPTGLYIGANIGLDRYNDDGADTFDDGASIGFQLGYRWTDHFRTEVELSGSAADFENSGDTLSFGRLTIGGYYDFLPTSQVVVPYVGGGIGTTAIDIDSDNGDQEDDHLLSWHAEAGLTLNVNEHFALIPSYRYTWVEDNTDLLNEDLTSHAVRIGARLSF